MGKCVGKMWQFIFKKCPFSFSIPVGHWVVHMFFGQVCRGWFVISYIYVLGHPPNHTHSSHTHNCCGRILGIVMSFILMHFDFFCIGLGFLLMVWLMIWKGILDLIPIDTIFECYHCPWRHGWMLPHVQRNILGHPMGIYQHEAWILLMWVTVACMRLISLLFSSRYYCSYGFSCFN